MNTITKETTKEEVKEAYKNYPAVKGDLVEKPFYESRYAPLFFEVKVGSKVLDVGCNDGSFTILLKEKRNCDITGVDVSEVALEEARKKGLNVLNADVEALPFADGTFDYVICAEVLSHLFDPKLALKEMRRVLKKNGVLLGSVPHKNLQTYAWQDKTMVRNYLTEVELRELLEVDFKRSYLKILNGGQFAVSMADSFLGNMPVEMLFKSGGKNIPSFDAALEDRSVLRCWMGFTQGPGVAYYRMSGFADKMQAMGAEVHYDPYNESNAQSTSEWCQKINYIRSENRFTNQHIVREIETLLRASDMSIFQPTSSRSILLMLTTARKGVIKKPMGMEIDDWIWDLPSYNSAAEAYRPNSEAEACTLDHVKLSDFFIVSTNYLKKKMEQIADGKPIYVIKNSLDFNIWDKVVPLRPLHEKNPDLVRIIYSGCQNHSGDIEIIKQPLLALFDEFPNLEFVSLPHKSTDDIENPRYIRVKEWMPLSLYPQALSGWEGDIGIAPLRDNETNRAKSNLRWLEYSALKLPTIASNVQPFKESITHGKDGILVGNSQQDWYDAMKALIVGQRERASIGEKAYVKVKKDFNMDKVAKTYLSVLKTIKDELIRDSSRIRKIA